MSYSKTLAKGMMIFMIAMVMTKMLSYGYKVIISRWLDAHQFGLFALALAMVSLIASIMVSGIHLALSRFIAYHRGKKETEKISGVIAASIQITTIANILAGIIFFVFAENIAALFHHQELVPLIKIFAFLFPLFGIVLTLQKIFEGFQRIELSTATELFLNVVRLSFLGIVIAVGASIEEVSISYVLATAITAIVFWSICEKRIVAFTKKSLMRSAGDVREIIIFSWPLMVSVIAHIILTWSDTILLGLFRSAREIGIYNIVAPTANLLTVPTFALATVFMPLLSTLFARKENEQMMKLYKTATRWTLLMSLPVIIGILLFPQRILNSTAGSGYVEGALALALLAIGVFLNAIATPANMILLAMDKTKFMMKNSIIACIVNIGLNLYLIPRYGMTGAAWAFLCSSIVISWLRMQEARTLVKATPLDGKMMTPLLIAIIVALIAFWTDKLLGAWITMDIIKLAVNGLVIGSSYLVLLYVSKCFDEEDKEIMKAVVARVTRKKN